MPILTTSVTELSHHVLETVCRQIVTQFLIKMGLDHIIGDDVYIKTKYSGISDTTDGELNARLRKDRFVADVTMQVNPTSVKWSEILTFSHSHSYRIGATMHRNFPIFNDREFGIGAYELAAPCSLLMQCSMHIQDRALAYSLPLRFFNKFHDSSVMSLLDLQYEYKLPNELIYVLGVIYNNKRYTTKFDNFYQYLKYWSGDAITKSVSTISHDRPALVVKKHNVECLSIVEYSEEEPNTDVTDSGTNMFTLSFAMTTQFNMVNGIAIDYPIIIENQLLPIEAIPLPRELRDRYVAGTLLDQGIDQFKEQFRWLHKEYIQTPFYDDWVLAPHCRLRDYSQTPFFIGLVTIDEDYPSTIIDLKDDLGDDYRLPPIVKKLFLRQEEICPGGSLQADAILTAAIFYGEKQLDPSELFFSPNAEIEHDQRSVNMPFRLVLTEITDILKLNPIYYPLLIEFIQYLDIHVIRQLWWLHNKGAIEFELSFHDMDRNLWISKDAYFGNYRGIHDNEPTNRYEYGNETGSRHIDADDVLHSGTRDTFRTGYGSGFGGGYHTVDLGNIDKVRFTDLSNHGTNPNYGNSQTISFDDKDSIKLQDIVSSLNFKHGDKYGDRIIARIFRTDVKPIRGFRS